MRLRILPTLHLPDPVTCGATIVSAATKYEMSMVLLSPLQHWQWLRPKRALVAGCRSDTVESWRRLARAATRRQVRVTRRYAHPPHHLVTLLAYSNRVLAATCCYNIYNRHTGRSHLELGTRASVQ